MKHNFKQLAWNALFLIGLFPLFVNAGSAQVGLEITPSYLEVPQNTTLLLSVTTDNFTEVNSMQFSIEVDLTMLSYGGVINFNSSLPNFNNGNISLSTTPDTMLTVIWSDPNENNFTLSNGAVLFNISFFAIEEPCTLGDKELEIINSPLHPVEFTRALGGGNYQTLPVDITQGHATIDIGQSDCPYPCGYTDPDILCEPWVYDVISELRCTSDFCNQGANAFESYFCTVLADSTYYYMAVELCGTFDFNEDSYAIYDCHGNLLTTCSQGLGLPSCLPNYFNSGLSWPFDFNTIQTIWHCTEGLPSCGFTCGITSIETGTAVNISCTTNTTGPGNDEVSVSINYEGVDPEATLTNNGAGTIDPNSDDPATDPDGTIIITNLQEGDSWDITITGGNCDLTSAGTVPAMECDPVSCGITGLATSFNCISSTDGSNNDQVEVMIDYTGIEPSVTLTYNGAGTLTGDDPSVVESGIILVQGLTEGSPWNISIIGGGCDFIFGGNIDAQACDDHPCLSANLFSFADTIVCSGESLLLSPAGNWDVYVWNDGSNTSTLSISNGGTYSVTVTDVSGCTVADTVVVEQPNPDLSGLVATGDTVCPGDIGIIELRGFQEINFQEHIISINADRANSVYSLDLDGDGDLDVFSASANDNKVAWYENDGNQNFSEHLVTDDAQGPNTVYSSDLDSDGNLDILSTSWDDDKVAWYKNNGNSVFSSFIVTQNTQGPNSIHVFDLNSDGEKDLLIGSDDKVEWFENDGNENFIKHLLISNVNTSYIACIADVNLDTFIDAIAASRGNGNMYWFGNDGSGSFTQHLIPNSSCDVASIFPIDLDKDGSVDLITCAVCVNWEYKVYWYKNDGNGNFSEHVLTNLIDNPKSIFAEDINDDSNIDFLVASHDSDEITWFENDGNQNFSKHIVSYSANGPSSVFSIDLNKDGNIDVLSSSFWDDKIAWYEQLPQIEGPIVLEYQANGSPSQFTSPLPIVNGEVEFPIADLPLGVNTIDIISITDNYGCHFPLNDLSTEVLVENNGGNCPCSIQNVEISNVSCNLFGNYSFDIDFDASNLSGNIADLYIDGAFAAAIPVNQLPYNLENYSAQGDLIEVSICDDGNPGCCSNEIFFQLPACDTCFVCPPNKFIDCGEYDAEVFDLVNDTQQNPDDIPVFNQNIQIGWYTNINDNCDLASINVTNNENIDQCGSGTVTRIYSPIDQNGNASTCVQLIIINNDTPFFICDTECWSTPISGCNTHSLDDGVEWPCDITLFDCGASVEPNDLEVNPSVNIFDARPRIFENSCDLVGVSYEDSTLNYTAPTCTLIQRTWIVVDWCQPDGSFPLGYVTWEYVQYLELVDPVITTPDMIPIQGGSFDMGCTAEQNQPDCDGGQLPVHEVSIYDFSLGQYEVTQGEWQALMGTNPSGYPNCGLNCPVENVSFYDALTYCNRLSQEEGFTPCYYLDTIFSVVFDTLMADSNAYIPVYWKKDADGYRLPTEAEWEYAARGGLLSQGFRYAGSDSLNEVAWWNCIDGCDTKPVGQKQPNELGAYDMSGNVYEWCWDWYDFSFYTNSPSCMPGQETGGINRVVRGGYWFNQPQFCTVSTRSSRQPGFGFDNYIGFRLARGPVIPASDFELTQPINGAIDVPVDAALNWSSPSTCVEGYYLSMGTSPGNYDLLDSLDVGNVNTYQPADTFPDNTTIYVQLIPYNGLAVGEGTMEFSFTTVNCAISATIVPSDTILCPGSTSSLTASGGDSYNWSTGDTTAVLSIDQGGNYSVTVTDGGGCTGMAEVNVQQPNPDLNMLNIKGDTLCSGLIATVSLGGFITSSFQEILIDDQSDWPHDIHTGDIDQDGDQDIAIAYRAGGKISWWENLGNFQFSEHEIDTGLSSPKGVHISDVDQDGFIDVLFGGGGGTAGNVSWYQNDGTNNFTRIVLDDQITSPNQVYAVDLDQDNDVDIVATGISDNHLVWYENDGNQFFTKHVLANYFGQGTSFFVSDLNQDGALDIASHTGFFNNRIILLENDGAENFSELTLDSLPFNDADISGTDVDLDGDIDLVAAIGFPSNQIALYENTGNSQFFKYLIADTIASPDAIFSTDIDLDSDEDLILSGINEIHIFLNDGNQNFSSQLVSDTSNQLEEVLAADMNNDGQPEILSASKADDKIALYRLLSPIQPPLTLTYTINAGPPQSAGPFTLQGDSLSFPISGLPTDMHDILITEIMDGNGCTFDVNLTAQVIVGASPTTTSITSTCNPALVDADTSFFTGPTGCDSLVISATALATPVTPEGLLAYYPFDGDHLDYSGRAYHGIQSNTQFDYDRFGDEDKALEFVGNNPSVELTNSDNLLPENGFTIAGWVKPDPWPAGHSRYVLFSKYNWIDGQREIQIQTREDGQIEFNVHYSDGNANPANSAFGYVKTNKWNHFVAVFDTANVGSLFVNGELADTFHLPMPRTMYPQPIYMGDCFSCGNGPLKELHGALDDVFIFERPLSPQEIRQLYLVKDQTPFQSVSICQGDSYSVGGNTYTQPGIYTDLLTNGYGCDSVQTTAISVLDPMVLSTTSDTLTCVDTSVFLANTLDTNDIFTTFQWEDPDGALIPQYADTPKTSILILEKHTGDTFFFAENTPLAIEDFSYFGVGYNGPVDYGSDWSPLRIDNFSLFHTGMNPFTYEEDFSSNPGFTSLSAPHTCWDTIQGNYWVNTYDNLANNYFAYSPNIGMVDDSSNFIIQFDLLNEKDNFGTYPSICFYNQEPAAFTDPSRVFRITFQNSVDVPSQFLIRDAANTTITSNNQYQENTWYTIVIKQEGLERQPEVQESGTYTLQATSTRDGQLCQNQSMITVLENTTPPTAQLQAQQNVLTCSTPVLTLEGTNSTGQGVLDYSWNTTDGNILSDNGDQATIDASGTYQLIVEDQLNGCSDTVTQAITQNITLPTAALATSTDTLTCSTPSISLNASGSSGQDNLIFYWSTANGNIVNANGADCTIDAPGTYQLIVEDAINGCQDTITQTIEQDISVPTAIIASSEDTLTCAVLSANLDGSGSSGQHDLVYFWNTTDGNITSANGPLSTIDASGTYQLIVEDAVNGCRDTAAYVIEQNTLPPVAAPNSSADTITCATSTITLDGTPSTGQGPLNYFWTTQNGTITNDNGISIELTAPGQYQLEVEDLANGCRDTILYEIGQNTTPPIAQLITSADTLTCADTLIGLDAMSSSGQGTLSFLWSTTDGNITISSGDNCLLNAPGTYQLIVIDDLNGCQDTLQQVIGQDTLPPTAILTTPADTLTCEVTSVYLDGTGSGGQGGLVWEWSTIDGNIASLGAGTCLIDAPGTYQMIIEDQQNGCTSTLSQTISENTQTPVADAGPDLSLECLASSVMVDAASVSSDADQFFWITSNGNIIAGSTTLSPTFNEPGTYSLIALNNSNGCADTATLSLTATTYPEVEILTQVSELYCADTITLQAVLPDGYLGEWLTNSNTARIDDPFSPTTFVWGLTPGEHNFQWNLSAPQDSCFDYANTAITITVAQPPLPADDVFKGIIGELQTLEVLKNDTLDGFNDFEFDYADPVEGDLLLEDIGRFTYQPAEIGTYTTTFPYWLCHPDCINRCDTALVELTMEFECLEDSLIVAPNVITPDGDGLNDVWEVTAIYACQQQFADNSLVISNRYGDIVYEANPYNNDWGGTNQQGEPLPQGTYYYILRLNVGEGVTLKGWVAIVGK